MMKIKLVEAVPKKVGNEPPYYWVAIFEADGFPFQAYIWNSKHSIIILDIKTKDGLSLKDIDGKLFDKVEQRVAEIFLEEIIKQEEEHAG